MAYSYLSILLSQPDLGSVPVELLFLLSVGRSDSKARRKVNLHLEKPETAALQDVWFPKLDEAVVRPRRVEMKTLGGQLSASDSSPTEEQEEPLGLGSI